MLILQHRYWNTRPALVHSEEINTASSGVSLLCKAAIDILCNTILATLLLEPPLLWRTLKRSALPVKGKLCSKR